MFSVTDMHPDIRGTETVTLCSVFPAVKYFRSQSEQNIRVTAGPRSCLCPRTRSSELLQSGSRDPTSLIVGYFIDPLRFLLFSFHCLMLSQNWVKASPGTSWSQYGTGTSNNRPFAFDIIALMYPVGSLGKCPTSCTSSSSSSPSSFSDGMKLPSGQKQRGFS